MAGIPALRKISNHSKGGGLKTGPFLKTLWLTASPLADLRSPENCHLKVEVGEFIVVQFCIHFLPPDLGA
jgi:hypothetical protein